MRSPADRAKATTGRVARVIAALAIALVATGASGSMDAAATGTPGPTRLAALSDPRITESSGLAVSPSHQDLVWTVNDSGSAAVVYGVSPTTGRTRAVLSLANTEARDIEAMAAGTDRGGRAWLWLADIGDNKTKRDSVVLRLVPEPTRVASQTVSPVSLRLRYPHGPADAETLAWLPDGRLMIVTKAFLTARVYLVPAGTVRQALAGHSVTEPVVAQDLGTIRQTLATDGVALPDGRLVVRGYASATIYRWDDERLTAQASLALPSQPQGETIAAERDGTVLVGSEGKQQPLWRVSLRAAEPLSEPTSSQAADGGPTNGSSEAAATRGADATATTGAGVAEPPRALSNRDLAWAGAGSLAVVLALGWVFGGLFRGARRRSQRKL